MARAGSRKRTVLIIVASALCVVAVLVAALVTWALTPLGPSPQALEALAGDSEVAVTSEPYGWTFTPTDEPPVTGFILYPGGRVDPRSYAPLAHDLALTGHLVVIVPMRLNLAVLSPNSADAVIRNNPDIGAWVIGGHSLGGTMAAQYAEQHPDTIEGLALLASYPAGGTDLSGSSIPVLSIYGTRDGVLSESSFKDAIARLPESTEYRPIEGGNHAQFGSYGSQPGDREASITAEDQTYETVEAIALLMRPIRMPLLR